MACFSTLGHARNGRAAETDLLSAIHDDGKGFVGIHSATITFTGWPKYGEMIGAGILMSIPGQRLMPPSCRRRCLPGDEAMASIFVLKDEIYQIRNFWRDKVRVLMRLDANKVDLNQQARPSEGPGLCRDLGQNVRQRPRVYSTLGHPGRNSDLRNVGHVGRGIKWAMRLVDADVTPRPAS